MTKSSLLMSAGDSKPAKIAEVLFCNASYDEIHGTLHVSFSTIATVKSMIEANAPLPVVKSPVLPTKVSSSVLKMTKSQTMTNSWLSARVLFRNIATTIKSPILR
jgi:hypothetical protein